MLSKKARIRCFDISASPPYPICEVEVETLPDDEAAAMGLTGNHFRCLAGCRNEAPISEENLHESVPAAVEGIKAKLRTQLALLLPPGPESAQSEDTQAAYTATLQWLQMLDNHPAVVRRIREEPVEGMTLFGKSVWPAEIRRQRARSSALRRRTLPAEDRSIAVETVDGETVLISMRVYNDNERNRPWSSSAGTGTRTQAWSVRGAQLPVNEWTATGAERLSLVRSPPPYAVLSSGPRLFLEFRHAVTSAGPFSISHISASATSSALLSTRSTRGKKNALVRRLHDLRHRDHRLRTLRQDRRAGGGPLPQGHPVRSWSTLLNPGNIDWDSEKVAGALRVNKLTREELQDQPLSKK
jgi:hypothetical protein